MNRHEHNIDRDDDFLSFCFELAVLAISQDTRNQIDQLKEQLMSAIDDANAQLADLGNAVTALQTAVASQPDKEAAVAQIATTLAGFVTQLNDLVNTLSPPAPAPVPDPTPAPA